MGPRRYSHRSIGLGKDNSDSQTQLRFSQRKSLRYSCAFLGLSFPEKDFGLLVRVGFAITDFTPPAYLRRSLQRPSWKSHLGDGFALRCFQRLS